MIFKKDLVYLQRTIEIYNRRIDRQYLISYKANKALRSNAIEITISVENFWHLVGCRLNPGQDAHEVYLSCLKGDDVTNCLSYTRQPQDVKRKAEVFCKLFDFVENAKTLRIVSTENTPEATMFCVGAGTVSGLIGYDKVSRYHIPKTTQDKSIFTLDKTANDKIFLILSKPTDSEAYDVVEYSISKEHTGELCMELADTYDIADDLY